jgi:hypothetical protein
MCTRGLDYLNLPNQPFYIRASTRVVVSLLNRTDNASRSTPPSPYTSTRPRYRGAHGILYSTTSNLPCTPRQVVGLRVNFPLSACLMTRRPDNVQSRRSPHHNTHRQQLRSPRSSRCISRWSVSGYWLGDILAAARRRAVCLRDRGSWCSVHRAAARRLWSRIW